MSGRGKRMCTVCGRTPAAFPRVDYCFGCWPGGPVTPPPCLSCGSRTEYFVNGQCHRCHRDGHPGVDSCVDCHAWGATRTLRWLCRGCDSWRRKFPTIASCRSCRTVRTLDDEGLCRLCHRQAVYATPLGRPADPVAANRFGQQLFFADMGRSPHTPIPADAAAPPSRVQVAGPGQHTLFAVHRDLAAHGRAGLPPPRDPTLAADLDRQAWEHAAASGWSPRRTTDTCHGLRILLGLQDVPGAPIPASDVAELRRIDLPVWTVLEVLAGAEMLVEDRTPTLDVWFAELTEGLPEQMVTELSLWWEIMKHGSTTPPRRRPRSPVTARLHAYWALPAMRAWAAAGRTTLREISREDVLNALPPSGNPRANTGQGLKSIFRVLKGRKILFVDPTARIQTGYTAARQPLPLDVEPVRAALQSPHPAQAAVVALIAFYGLRAGQIPPLRLTDLRDGRLHHDGRVIPLAEPVLVRLAAYLDYRNHRWPNSRNPYLFVHYRTGHRTTPVGLRWVWLTIGPGLSPTALREDRILDEARATDGDVRRVCDLFGLSIEAACRYTATLNHPDLASDTSAGTQGSTPQ